MPLSGNQHLGGSGSQVVLRGHGGPVGSGHAEDQQIAGSCRGQHAVPSETVPGLADRTDDVVGKEPLLRTGLADRMDLMEGAIQRWPQEIVHAGIDHQQGPPGRGLLPADDPGDQDRRSGHQAASGLDPDLAPGIPEDVLDQLPVGLRAGRDDAVPVGDPQPASQVQDRDPVAMAPQYVQQAPDPAEGPAERFQGGNLAADMDRHALDLDRFHASGLGIEPHSVIQRDAEFAVPLPGGEHFMGSGLDIRIDPERDGCPAVHAGGDLVQLFQLHPGFDIDHADSALQGEGQLLLGLAGSGEGDLAGWNPGFQGQAQLSLGHHIGTASLQGQDLRDGQGRIGLQGVADLVVEPA